MATALFQKDVKSIRLRPRTAAIRPNRAFQKDVKSIRLRPTPSFDG